MIRHMQESDFDECIRVAKLKYAKQHPRIDHDGMWQFLDQASQGEQYLLLTGRNVFFCAGATRSFIEPEIVVGALWVFTRQTDPAEFVSVIRVMESWATDLGAIECGFGNISDKDFTRVAARLGYKPSAQYFSKGLR